MWASTFDWVLVNNSRPVSGNTVTITNAASGNNINGNARLIAITSSARFRTYKTAADTFATYRIA
jgi:hypothetical protein